MRTKFTRTMFCAAFLILNACDNGTSIELAKKVSYKKAAIQLESKAEFVIPDGSATSDTLEIQFEADSNSVYSIEFNHNGAVIPEFLPADPEYNDTILSSFGVAMNKYLVPSSKSETRSIFIYGLPSTTISLTISKTKISAWWLTRSKNVDFASFTKDSLISSRPLQVKFGLFNSDSAWTNGNLISTIKGVRDGVDDIDRDWYSLKVDSGVNYRIELQSLRCCLINADIFTDSGKPVIPISNGDRDEYRVYHRKNDLVFESSKLIYIRVSSTFPAGYRIAAYRI